MSSRRPIEGRRAAEALSVTGPGRPATRPLPLQASDHAGQGLFFCITKGLWRKSQALFASGMPR
ncbi:hypothetical protein CNECB9_1550009 [Cupriavidus necator]|uniref:Uncharacterized protein n=1 Tax=Cupriavidus necator TaxID=106590 RepID=A0A1K0I9Z3_CUPNE|nr:hypothetical protein CNECB9_1550009 [Cupriavidus necator]